MTTPLSPEQTCLLELARTTWNNRGRAKSLRVPYNEETITETMLLELAGHWPGQVSIRAFSKAEEAKTGADWLWCLLSADGRWVQSMLVQAKRLDDRDRDYSSIKKTIGSSKKKAIGPVVRQIDRLIAAASALRVPPLYAFYNHLTDVTRVPSTCQSLAATPSHESWGITLALAEDVRDTLPKQSFDIHKRHSIPLHCLLCSVGTGQASPQGSAGDANRKLTQLIGFEKSFAAVDPHGFSQGIPAEIERLLSLPELEDEADDEDGTSQLHEALKDYPSLAGIVVLRDAERPADPDWEAD